jgi:hypothetical protein
MSREYLYLIDVADGDPVQVKKYSNVGTALQFSQGGVTTLIPWEQVTRIRWADVADLSRCADPDDPADEVSDAVKAFYDDLDKGEFDYADRTAEDTAPEGGRTTAEMSPSPSGGATHNVTRAGAGQEQVGKDPAEVDALKTDTVADDSRAREWPSDADNATMRAWAREQGLDVNESGPVSKSVATAYAANNS